MPMGSFVGLCQRRGQIVLQFREIAFGGLDAPTDQNVIEAVFAMCWQHKASDFAQSPLGPIAGNGISDLLRTCEAYSYPVRLSVRSGAILKREGRGRDSTRRSGCEEISAFGQDGEAMKLHVRNDETADGYPRRLVTTEKRALRRSAFSGHERDEHSGSCGRPWWPCARESRAAVCGQGSRAGMCASSSHLSWFRDTRIRVRFVPKSGL